MKNKTNLQIMNDSVGSSVFLPSSQSVWASFHFNFNKSIEVSNPNTHNAPKIHKKPRLYRWHIKKQFGQGGFECLRFTNIVLTRMSCKLTHAIDFVNEDSTDNFSFHIILGGISHYNFYDMDKRISIQSPQVWAESGKLGRFRRTIPANQTLKKICIGINKDYLKKLYKHHPDNKFLADIVKDNYAIFQSLPFSSSKVFELTNHLLNLPFNSNKLDQMYIEGHSLMLVSILLKDSLSTISNLKPHSASYAKLAAMKVREHLNSYPDSNKTIKELARFSGTNSCYLKYEFKKMTSLTIHQYRQQARMQLALALIGDSQNSLPIVSQQLGFKNTDYFIRVFKAYFGQHPKAYRKIINANYDSDL